MKTKQWISCLHDAHPKQYGYSFDSPRLKNMSIINHNESCKLLLQIARGYTLQPAGIEILTDFLDEGSAHFLYTNTNPSEICQLVDDIYSRFTIFGEGTLDPAIYSGVLEDLKHQKNEYMRQKSIVDNGISGFVWDPEKAVSVIDVKSTSLLEPELQPKAIEAYNTEKKWAQFGIKIQDSQKVPVLDLVLIPEGKKGQNLKPIAATRTNLQKFFVHNEELVSTQWYTDFQNFTAGVPEKQRGPILRLIAPLFKDLLAHPETLVFIQDPAPVSSKYHEVRRRLDPVNHWELRFYTTSPRTFMPVLVELEVDNPKMYQASRLVPAMQSCLLALQYNRLEWSYQTVPNCEGILKLAELLSNPAITKCCIQLFLGWLREAPIPWLQINPSIFTQKQIIYRPQPRITIFDAGYNKAAIQMDLDFITPDSVLENTVSASGEPVLVQQEAGFTKTIMALLLKSPIGENAIAIQNKLKFSLGLKQFQNWLATEALQLLDSGFDIFSVKEKQSISRPKNISVKIRVYSRNQWLEFKPEFSDADGKIEAFLTVLPGRFEARDKNGRLIALDKNELQKLSSLMEAAQEDNGVFRIPSDNGLLALSILDKEELEELPQAPQIARFARLLSGIHKLPKPQDIKNLHANLRPYQMEGFSRLLFWHQEGFSGILADDMGLGKTVQTLALLQFLKNRNQLGKTLLILPLSALSNWKSEIQKFTNLSCEFFHGSSLDLNQSKADLILSTYGTVRQREKEICEIGWDYLILDESQNIKNLNALTTKSIKKIHSQHRLALSGTPLENHLLELFSLFDFLMPGYLGNQRWFKEHIATPIEKQDFEPRKKLLKSLISPFMLRRTKKEVLTDLPPKIETDKVLNFQSDQQEAYAITAKSFREALDTYLVEDRFAQTPQTLVLEALLRLRQICIAPILADSRFQNTSSAKLEYLVDTLPQLLEEGHKVLVFSQFPSALNQLEKSLSPYSLPILRLYGSHSQKERDKSVNDFQSSLEPVLFLLSIKAGGTALNLTEADYVFILDPWWNPFVERQATDRAHRIGQKNTVHIYRLITSGTVEERIREMQKNKQSLFEDFAEGGSGMLASLTLKDIRYLLD